MVTLQRAGLEDAERVLQMQVQAFQDLLERYRDYDTNPAAEPVGKITWRIQMEGSAYYFILAGEEAVGFIRVQEKGRACRVSPIGILPGHQGRGYAQEAMLAAEKLYPAAARWELDTIKQEAKLCYLYEKLGYRRTGTEESIQPGMTIVYYEKNITI